MNRKFLAVASLIVLVAAVALVVFLLQNQPLPHSSPPLLYDCTFSVLNPQVTEVAGYNGFFNNVSQGLQLQVNMTFTSLTNQPIMIPIENLSARYGYGNYSLVHQQAFNYSFSLNQVILQPDMSNSTLLTINIAEDTPLGRYSIGINLGNAEAVNDDENLLSCSGSWGLGIIVTSSNP